MKTRILTVIAQDPSVKSKGHILRTQLEIPWEELEPGPKGSRIHVIDYDISTDTTFAPHQETLDEDPYAKADDNTLLTDPRFHAINAYVICMSVLTAFEYALGRRIRWSFRGPHLKIAPHAFAEANAFYSRYSESLLFGYIPKRGYPIFTCLSHDIVAHETTHSIIDAMRPNYMRFSSPDQAGFHEGFADVIALLSVLTQKDMITFALSKWDKTNRKMIRSEFLNRENLKFGVLFGLAEEFGSVFGKTRGEPLRRSVLLEEGNDRTRTSDELNEPHKRGELLCAATMNAFLQVWFNRFTDYIEHSATVSRDHIINEGAAAARHLRTIMIRSLDYVPPIHLTYGEYLVGVLTADAELYPEDHYNYRAVILEWFGRYGISAKCDDVDQELIDHSSCWKKEPPGRYSYENVHADELEYSREEAYRFVWDNRRVLNLHKTAYTEIISVRPIKRISTDGFTVRETIIEYLQLLDATVAELEKGVDNNTEELRIDVDDRNVSLRLHGGGVIILDEFHHVKFHIANSLTDKGKQQKYIDYLLWQNTDDDKHLVDERMYRFSKLHIRRMTT